MGMQTDVLADPSDHGLSDRPWGGRAGGRKAFAWRLGWAPRELERPGAAGKQ